jgi:hypothetical protein
MLYETFYMFYVVLNIQQQCKVTKKYVRYVLCKEIFPPVQSWLSARADLGHKADNPRNAKLIP